LRRDPTAAQHKDAQRKSGYAYSLRHPASLAYDRFRAGCRQRGAQRYAREPT
jgi:hypothetical protein